jgi:hypothetical protein
VVVNFPEQARTEGSTGYGPSPPINENGISRYCSTLNGNILNIINSLGQFRENPNANPTAKVIFSMISQTSFCKFLLKKLIPRKSLSIEAVPKLQLLEQLP